MPRSLRRLLQGREQVLVGELLCRAIDIHERVLDVAAGSGNAALAAGRRGARVMATDLVPLLLEVAVRRAKVESLLLAAGRTNAQIGAGLRLPDRQVRQVAATVPGDLTRCLNRTERAGSTRRAGMRVAMSPRLV